MPRYSPSFSYKQAETMRAKIRDNIEQFPPATVLYAVESVDQLKTLLDRVPMTLEQRNQANGHLQGISVLLK